MDFALFLGAFVPPTTPQFLARAAKAAEERGFHSVWVGEHVVLFDQYAKEYPYADSGEFPLNGEAGMAEPFTTLAWIAGQTSTIRVGTSVILVPQRNPLYTAKEVANVDWLSGGRFDFGIGVGWQREEFEALQVPWERRGARNDEYIELMKRLWIDPLSAHEGEFWSLAPSRAFPKPVQTPHPPIHVGLAELLEPTGRSIDDVYITASPNRDSARGELAPAFAEAGGINPRGRVGPEAQHLGVVLCDQLTYMGDDQDTLIGPAA